MQTRGGDSTRSNNRQQGQSTDAASALSIYLYIISEIARTYVELQPILSKISFPLQRGSVDWQHSLAHPQKHPLDAKISQISLTQTELQPIQFQISLSWQRGLVGENAIGSIQWPIPENPPIDAKILQISLTQAELQLIVIAYFVPNFVAMATREDPG